jgi:Peptidase C39 family
VLLVEQIVMRGFPDLTVSPQPAAKRQNRNSTRILLTAAFALLLCLASACLWYYYGAPRKISSTGGLYFFSRYEIPVRRFAQADPRWSDDPLGATPSTMGEEGCAVSSSAMVLAFYGQDVDPGRLNAFLTANDTPQGWLYWEKAADFYPGQLRHAYENLPSYFLIDWNLLRRNPVIVRIRLPNSVTHFVVIAGKQGFDYLIQDPGSGGESGTYPLSRLAPEIEALRFYEKIRGD